MSRESGSFGRLLVTTLAISFTLIALGSWALYLFFDKLGRLPPDTRLEVAMASMPDPLRPPSPNQLLVLATGDGLSLQPEFIEPGASATTRTEQIEVLVTQSIETSALTLTERGPDGSHLLPFTPRAVYTEGGRVIVDLDTVEGAPDIDFRAECLLAYAVVNSVTENFDDIHEVLFLIDGQPAQTLAGALDISEPLVPNAAIRRRN